MKRFEIGEERAFEIIFASRAHLVCMVLIMVFSSGGDLQEPVLSVSRSASGQKRKYDQGMDP